MPENSGWKPAPTSSSEPTTPSICERRPRSAGRCRRRASGASTCRSRSGRRSRRSRPARSSRSTSRSAQSSRVRGTRRCTTASFSERVRASRSSKRRPRPRRADRDVRGRRQSGPRSAGTRPGRRARRAGRTSDAVDELGGARHDALEGHRAERLDVRRDGVAVAQDLDRASGGRRRRAAVEAVEDRRQEEPRQHRHGQQVLDVAEEDVQRARRPRPSRASAGRAARAAAGEGHVRAVAGTRTRFAGTITTSITSTPRPARARPPSRITSRGNQTFFISSPFATRLATCRAARPPWKNVHTARPVSDELRVVVDAGAARSRTLKTSE